MNDEMSKRLLGMFENQSKGLTRIVVFFVLAMVFLQLIFIRDYIQLNFQFEQSQVLQQSLEENKGKTAQEMQAIDAFRKQLAAVVDRTQKLIHQFPPTLRQGIRDAPERRLVLNGLQARVRPEMAQMTAQMAQSALLPELRPDIPLSRSVEDIQRWIDEQFVKINKTIDSDIKQPLLKQINALSEKLDANELSMVRKGIESIEVKQPDDRSWWHAYSGKIAMSEASSSDLSSISDRIQRRAEGIYDATNSAWNEIESNLKRLKSQQLEQERKLKELEKELHSTLAALKSNVEQLGLPFGNMIPVKLALFLKIYPVLLLAVVIWLISRMRKLLLIRYELFAVSDNKTEQESIIEAGQFDRIYVPWIIQPFVNGDAERNSLSGTLQLISLAFVIFLLPLWVMADTTYLFTSYPSDSVAGLAYLYAAGIALLAICIPILYRRLGTVFDAGAGRETADIAEKWKD